MAVQEMRLRIGARIRYPDVLVCSGALDQTTRTVTDAVAIFEVLSDDTATTDRVEKLIDYAAVPSLRCYVLLEQTAMAATLVSARTGRCVDGQRAYRRGAGPAGPRHHPAARGAVSGSDLRCVGARRRCTSTRVLSLHWQPG